MLPSCRALSQASAKVIVARALHLPAKQTHQLTRASTLLSHKTSSPRFLSPSTQGTYITSSSLTLISPTINPDSTAQLKHRTPPHAPLGCRPPCHRRSSASRLPAAVAPPPPSPRRSPGSPSRKRSRTTLRLVGSLSLSLICPRQQPVPGNGWASAAARVPYAVMAHQRWLAGSLTLARSHRTKTTPGNQRGLRPSDRARTRTGGPGTLRGSRA